MLVFPNCKINLGLNILAKRSDGFHELETIFYPVKEVKDILEFVPSKELQLTVTGTNLQIDATQNIVYKAYQLLQTDFTLPPLHIHLHKIIPHGAGLGGGSANASFMLVALNDFFDLKINNEKLKKYAEILGSDCPFFIENSPCIANGKGVLLTPISLDLSSYFILLVKPPFCINTAMAFENIIPVVPKKNVKTIIAQPIETWKNELYNDFEKTIFPKYPVVENIKKELFNQGALYASMSGTGSTVFGIFSEKINIDVFEKEGNICFWSGL